MKTSIIIPTLCRPEQLGRNVRRLLDTVQGLDTEIIVVAEANENALSCILDLPVQRLYRPDWHGSVAGWNYGASKATGDVLVTGADDLWWYDGWLQNALAQMELAGTCYCALNDLMWDGWTHDPTHWLITRKGIVDYCGGCIMPPVYKTTFPDNEIAARIKRAGQYTWCKQAITEHLHFANGKAELDKSYMTMSRYYFDDEAIFKQRQAAGFPDDFEPMVFL